jgi:hypothetical protein
MPSFSRRNLLLGFGTLALATLPRPALAVYKNPRLYDGSEIADWQAIFSRITFDNLPPALEDGSVEVPPTTIQTIGYNPNRTWKAGTPISQILMLGDIQMPSVFGAQLLSLNQIANLSGLNNLATKTLQDFGLSPLQSVKNLVDGVKGLGNQLVSSVKPILDLYKLYGGFYQNPFLTISQLLIANPQFGQQVLGSLPNLSIYPITSIPGLTDTPLNSLGKWGQAFIKDIPGLGNITWARFAISTLLSGRFAQIDLVLGAKEALRTAFRNTVTGSSNEGFNVPCGNQSCSHVELTGNGFKGLRHILNPAQQLSGGFGILQFLNGGKEGTGWEPFGANGPKVGLLSVSEKTDTVQFGMCFFIDAWWFGSHLGRSPKFIRVPFFTASVKNIIPAP